MIRFWHTTTGFWFYLFSLMGFVAFIAMRNGVGGTLPIWWLHVFDVPLFLTAILYAGTGLYLNIRGSTPKPLLGWLIFLVMLSIWLVLSALNYWAFVAEWVLPITS